jgi:hypothetical protein
MNRNTLILLIVAGAVLYGMRGMLMPASGGVGGSSGGSRITGGPVGGSALVPGYRSEPPIAGG